MNTVYKRYFWIILLIALVASGIHFYQGYRFCAWSISNGLVCPVIKISMHYYIWIGIISLLIYMYSWSKVVSSKLPKYIAGIFLVVSILYVAIPSLFSENGFAYLKIKDTLHECELWSGYEAGGESYAACYSSLAKKTGNPEFCKKSTITKQYGCQDFFEKK